MDIKSNLNLCSGKITLPNLGEDYRLRVYTCECNYSIFNFAFSEGVCCDHLTFDVGPDSYCIRNSCNYIGANSFGITTCAPHIELQSYCINFTSLPFWSGSSGDEIAEKQLVPRSYVDNEITATEAYVDAKINEINYTEFEEGLKIGKGACVVDVSTDEDVIVFNETELPTTGGTVLTSENIYNKIPMPCTCVWWLEPKSPDENGKITWTCELMYNGQYANSDIPPNVVITRIDESNPDKFHYVDADVSFGTYGDIGVIYSSYITVDMNSNEAIPQCTFKVTISNIHTNNQLT